MRARKSELVVIERFAHFSRKDDEGLGFLRSFLITSQSEGNSTSLYSFPLKYLDEVSHCIGSETKEIFRIFLVRRAAMTSLALLFNCSQTAAHC